jgi:DNA-binding transcriptional LysR family regulator
MELRHLRYFACVGKVGNIHKASVRLGITQPALSRQIQDLETELGFSLFDRQARGVCLTPAGREFLEEAQVILQKVEAAKERFRLASQGKTGTLRIAYSGAATREGYILQCISSFRVENANLELKAVYMLSHDQLEALESGEIDAGFGLWSPSVGEGVEPTAGLKHMTLGEDYYVLALPAEHPLARRKHLALADLTDQPFIFMSRVCTPELYDQLIEACRRKGFYPRIVDHVDHEIGLLNFVASGNGLCFMNASVEHEHHAGIVLRQVSDFSVPIHLDLVWMPERVTPALIRFISNVSDVTNLRNQLAPRKKTDLVLAR